MKTISCLALCFISTVICGKLDKTYLPPNSAGGSGGNENILNTPINPDESKYTIASPSPVYGPAHHDERQSNIQRSNNPEARANLIKFDNNNDGSGNYHFDFETENRIRHEEHGQIKQDGEAVVVQGSYSYVGDDGKTYTVTYIADENGFQPAGEHINEAITKTASDAARLSVNDVHSGSNGYASNNYEGVNAKSENVNGGYQY
ncbi:pupal cuticle protein 27-like [Onthophagus taurus]|uniref:pupal cuticle protein 27-like n=1 Tax=Onthophagus taurus TaxID=166361 RepID=UPI000C207B45|nr:pupal cuticle protein 27-like [Onthophagus taurus]